MIHFKKIGFEGVNKKMPRVLASILNVVITIFLGIFNFVVSLGVGILNMFIGFGINSYKRLIKPYKYEFLYIFLVGVGCIFFSINLLNGGRNGENFSFLGDQSNGLYILLIIISSLIAVFGLTFYILTIFCNKKIDKKYFWYIRSFSYLVSLFFLLFIFDYCILDFVYRYQNVKKPTAETGSYDIMVFFLREYNVNFVDGIKTTLYLALLGTVFGLILALGMVALRMQKVGPRDNDLVKFFKKIGSGIANVYVTVIRGTPMIVQAFVFFYLVVGIVRANVTPEEFVNFRDNIWTPVRAGLFTVSINTTAYLTEVLRGGINSVDKGQSEAAMALGLGKFRTMMLIVFPQAIKNSLPSIGNEFIVNIKDTSVLTMIGVLDLFSVAKKDILGIYSAKNLEAYLLVAVFYLILTYFTSKLLQYAEVSMDMPVKEITSSN